MKTFAVIREKTSRLPFETSAPGFVFEVERETAQSLVGLMVAEDGKRNGTGFYQYECRPTFYRGWQSDKVGTITGPGLVDKRRQIGPTFSTFEGARDALTAMKVAWGNPSASAVMTARERYNERRKALEVARESALEEAERKVLAERRALDDATRTLNEALSAFNDARNAAVQATLAPEQRRAAA